MAVSIIPAGRGTRHTTTWAENQLPQLPREGLAYLYINGDLPLTALMSMVKSKKPKTTRFSRMTKNFPSQIASVTGVYTNEGLSSAYSAGANAIGLELFVKVDNTATNGSTLEFRANHTVVLRNELDPRDDVACKVIEANENGASSYVRLRTLQATTATTADPAAATHIKVGGNAQEQGSVIPDEVNYNPVEIYNYPQIFWTPYSVTGTQLEVELITGDAYKEEKREKFEMHGIEIEKAYWWGERYQETVKGKEKNYTQGMIPMIRTYAPEMVFDYRYDTNYSGMSWLEGGWDWLNKKLEITSRYGRNRRNATMGSVARLSLTELGAAYGTMDITPDTAEFGLDIERWRSPNGMRLNCQVHPLFSQDPVDRSSMVIWDLANVEEMVLRQTKTTKDNDEHTDGIKEGWLTESGLQFLHPTAFAYFCGMGQDNLV